MSKRRTGHVGFSVLNHESSKVTAAQAPLLFAPAPSASAEALEETSRQAEAVRKPRRHANARHPKRPTPNVIQLCPEKSDDDAQHQHRGYFVKQPRQSSKLRNQSSKSSRKLRAQIIGILPLTARDAFPEDRCTKEQGPWSGVTWACFACLADSVDSGCSATS